MLPGLVGEKALREYLVPGQKNRYSGLLKYVRVFTADRSLYFAVHDVVRACARACVRACVRACERTYSGSSPTRMVSVEGNSPTPTY